ncbi:cadherin-23 [Daktulosphaira vitifoliae]|uniref:cadherin-23 n=1 Tax=Daktulosphaira vitifoliae TaxID=58002 RepID=UPI0021AB06B5|nr:cadherin-23 [Daktulosphaira vitifoliae]XP_050524906.1 cadherin-23 [Daktulosphaira vitifoliae]
MQNMVVCWHDWTTYWSLIVITLVHICDANRSPQFVTDNWQTEIIVRLKEGPETPIGSLIYRVRGIDPDGDKLIFGVREPGDKIIKVENHSKNEAYIYLKIELDREVKDEYLLVLTLTDGRLGEGNFITQSFLLIVDDINDNAPVFKPYQNTIFVPEDSQPTVIATIEATDADEGPYGQVVYYLQDTDALESGLFAISTVNGQGVIRLVGSLDYEKSSLHQLKILAVDRSTVEKRNTGTAAIFVKVQDVEDQPPEFVVVTPVARVSEDAPAGTSILQVKAIDGDRGVENRIIYSITRGGNGLLEVEPNSGIVYTTGVLNREDPSIIKTGAIIIEIMATEDSRNIFPNPSTKTEVTVIVTDVNDETPKFRSGYYIAEINENAQQNTPVNFLGDAIPQVYDYDQGKNGTFRLRIQQGRYGYFDVTPSEGINEASFLIRVNKTVDLDYELIKVINFTLVAIETIPKNPKYSIVPVAVYLRDVNDNYPEFSHPIYEVFVSENSVSGKTIGRVEATDKDSGLFGTEGIRYTSIRGSCADSLSLNADTGEIIIKSDKPVFDREQISKHFLTIEARDDLGLGNRNTVQLIINVDDINDNAPRFLSSKYETRMKENHLIFESPVIIEARDSDLNGTKNSEIAYRIIHTDYPGDVFSIDPITGVLKPKRPVDFEKLQNRKSTNNINGNLRPIHVVVQAQDYGVPPLADEAHVIIYVEDVNDFGPKFENPSYETSISEDLAGGSTILQVNAWDEDGSAPNNVIVYRLSSGAEDKFVIDAYSGVIKVAHGASLDPDKTQPKTDVYNLKVIAIDGGIGDQQLSSSVNVTINIQDVNNKVPLFKKIEPIYIKENKEVGSIITKVEAEDPDAKPILRYKIDIDTSEARNENGVVVSPTEYDWPSAFSLNPVDGFLRVGKLLDREKVEIIRLTVIVEDIAAINGVQFAEGFLIIHVDDENDNSPIFRQDFYKRTVMENSQPGVPIITVLADDADKNRTIQYFIEESSTDVTDLIRLDPESGEIVVAGRIDHEQLSWINITVRASDNGIPIRSSFTNVALRVIDENDNNPYFTDETPNNITIPENTPIGTSIATMIAMDADSSDYGKVTYLLDRLSSQGKFTIDTNTGILRVADVLDREQLSTYNLIVEAWDNYQYGYVSGESRNAFKQIMVTVSDINDMAPGFEHLPTECVVVTEFHTVGDIILLVKANDADDPNTVNGRISFSIEDGNERELFAIYNVDYWSGRLYTTSSLRNLYGNYSLLIRAQDGGTPQKSNLATINVCVIDVNDNAPRFVSPPYNATVRLLQNMTVGSSIISVEAIDDDVGQNAEIRYRLKQDLMGDWKTFSIDEVTGLISLKKPLNKEVQKMYQIRVEAYDLGIPTPLSSDLELTIHVRSSNDFQPRFLINEITVNFTEHREPGAEYWQLIDTVEREDLNDLEKPPSSVCYYVISGNDDNLFIIEPLNHRISVAGELDRETKDNYDLMIKASEDCLHSPPVNNVYNKDDDSLLKVSVVVNDINDHAPEFIKRIFTGGVTTEADFGNEFMHVKAIDADKGINSELSYYIVPNSLRLSLAEGLDSIQYPPFLIDISTGAIYLNFDPQKGMKGYFDFQVLVNDTGGLYDVARVLIYLLREDQRVRFVVRQNPSQLREKVDIFREILGNVTGAIVNVDEYKVHETNDGRVDKTRSDMYLHFVDHRDNSIMEVPHVLRVIDENIEHLDTLFKEFNVLDTQAAEPEPLRRAFIKEDNVIWMWLIGTTFFLGLLLVVVISICLSQRSHYRRQLKAATISAFDPRTSDHVTSAVIGGRVPNTNIHSVAGSNPMWMQAYENEWYKDRESLSQTSERDSLDDNTTTSTTSPQPIERSTTTLFIKSNDCAIHTDSTNDYCERTRITVKNLETTEL